MSEKLVRLQEIMQGKSVTIPEGGISNLIIKEHHPEMPQFKFLGPDNRVTDFELAKEKLQGFYLPKLDVVAVCDSSIKIRKKPLEHPPVSKANYWYQFAKGNDTWYGSEIEPEGETGEDHFHIIGDSPKLNQTEYYEIKYGSFYLRHHEDDIWRQMPDKFKIPAGVFHRGKAGPDGAFLTIITPNGESYGEDFHHVRASDLAENKEQEIIRV